MIEIEPLKFKVLYPKVPERPRPHARPDHDPGDESDGDESDRRTWVFTRGGVAVGFNRVFWDYVSSPPEHDQGDEDDFMNYVPSYDASVGLRVWAPR